MVEGGGGKDIGEDSVVLAHGLDACDTVDRQGSVGGSGWREGEGARGLGCARPTVPVRQDRSGTWAVGCRAWCSEVASVVHQPQLSLYGSEPDSAACGDLNKLLTSLYLCVLI